MLLFGASGAVARSWSARLPDPVATHWGLRGVDRTAASLPGLLAGWLGIAVVLCVAVAAISLAGNQPPLHPPAGRCREHRVRDLPRGLLVVIAWSQLDLAQAHAAHPPGGGIAVVAVLSSLLGLGAAALATADTTAPTPGPVPMDAARTALGTDERAVWTATMRLRGTDAAATISRVLVVVAVALSAQPAVLSQLLIPILLVVMGRWRATVDRTGIWARGVLGVPRTGLALAEVVRADVVPIHPLREFGGFGLRSDLRTHRLMQIDVGLEGTFLRLVAEGIGAPR